MSWWWRGAGRSCAATRTSDAVTNRQRLLLRDNRPRRTMDPTRQATHNARVWLERTFCDHENDEEEPNHRNADNKQHPHNNVGTNRVRLLSNQSRNDLVSQQRQTRRYNSTLLVSSGSRRTIRGHVRLSSQLDHSFLRGQSSPHQDDNNSRVVRCYHSSSPRPFYWTLGAIVAGVGWAVYRTVQGKPVTPDSSLQAQEEYQKLEQAKEQRNQHYRQQNQNQKQQSVSTTSKNSNVSLPPSSRESE
mmetsp:Transcript_19415/g.40160  ORF Transcript_19415/g.40160 Transcript_19415/m.40160 type:complete len:245 (-) Transcript_19415:1036-1770(-)